MILPMFLALGTTICTFITPWGFFGHQKINRHAVYSLPSEMIRFYKNNIEYISEHAVDADKRRYVDSAEGPKHYIDLDAYEPNPFDSLPRSWYLANQKYTPRIILQNGIVPWQIPVTYSRLVRAFSARDSLAILKYSADLGHYISDAHVPLHTTKNYNGQLSGQIGIHGFWESRLPELFFADYDMIVGRSFYIEDPLKISWEIVQRAYGLKDTVLALEKKLSINFPSHRKFAFSERNGIIQRQYSEEYSRAYHKELKGMVEKQFRSSIHLTASFWYSAWIEAGQPDLNNLTTKLNTETEISFFRKVESLFRKGKILGREEN